MLDTMTRPHLDTATSPVPIQTGPVYACFQCGQPVHGLTPWPVDHRNYSPLDDWAEHIAYLRLTCGCSITRVAKLGDAIMPLRFHENVRDPRLRGGASWRELVYANVRAVREAVAFLVANVPEDERKSDPAARVVYSLLAGTLAPEQAIAQIRAMREEQHG